MVRSRPARCEMSSCIDGFILILSFWFHVLSWRACATDLHELMVRCSVLLGDGGEQPALCVKVRLRTPARFLKLRLLPAADVCWVLGADVAGFWKVTQGTPCYLNVLTVHV
eukprot:3862139-Pleurochrysis_carterae.AAC.1